MAQGGIVTIDYSAISKTLMNSLGLRVAPVAVCLAEEPPVGISAPSKPAAAGCVFWEWGAREPIATTAKDHANCVIGMFTHHMPIASRSQQENLNDCLKVFADLGYVRTEDVPSIPSLKEESKYVVYAPLASTPLEPSAVLLFANSRQSLAITEAVQQVTSGIPPALGRPACAVIPYAINTGMPALSLGCCGARSYLDVLTDDFALWALPGSAIGEYSAKIKLLAQANSILAGFHAIRRKDIEQGESPSVKESLSRMEND
jgi:uncharacterized protein (DUF169 family)